MSFLPYLQFSKVFHCGLILVESLEAGNGHNRVRRVATMKEFIRKYEDRIHGALSCFDRMLFRGYLPIMSGWAMAGFLDRLHQDFSSLKPFLLENSERVKNHAIALAQKHGRPFRYLASNIKKEEAARELAQGDGIQHGLVCIFSILEPCRTFSFLFKKERPNQRPFVKSARRKCLHLYFYFMDRHFGLIHVRIQTWFPMPIQVYLNGHEWLARKLEANGVRFTKHDNAFLWIEDMVRAQKFSDRFANLNWPKILSKYAKLVTPQMQDILQDCSHYWVTAQSELSTDILFRSRQGLSELYPELLSHGTLCFGAKEVMTFLGRKLRGNFEGEIVSDLSDLARPDAELFQTVMDGDHCLRGFTNKDIRARLASTPHLRNCGNEPKKASAKISRILRRFRTHGLIAKIPRTRRWRVTIYGRRVMGKALYLRHHDFPRLYSRPAA